MKKITSLHLEQEPLMKLKGQGFKVSPLMNAMMTLVLENPKILKLVKRELQ